MRKLKRMLRTALQSSTMRRLALVAAIVIGVLLIATGVAVVQAAGAAVMAIGVLLARGEQPGAGSSDSRGEVTAAWQRARRAVPDWAWLATVAVFILVAAIVLVIEVVGSGDIDAATFGNLAKGAIALAMMATVALWWPVRLPGWFDRPRTDPQTVEPEPADPR